MFKNTKGITLISLIVTIIILLILAGILIASLTGSGLFSKTQQAKQEQENAIIKEEATLADYENKINQYINGSRETVTIPKEEYEELKEAIIPKDIDFELTVTPTTIYTKGAYVVGSEVQITISIDVNLSNGVNMIGKVPKEYGNGTIGQYNACYIVSNGGTTAGHLCVDAEGNVYLQSWTGNSISHITRKY